MVSLSLPYYLYKVTSVFLPTGSVGEPSPQPPTINEQEKRCERLEKLKRELQNIKNARDKLQGILANYTINNRINFETYMLEMQHDQVMTDLKRMPQGNSEALSKCKELTKENQWFNFRKCHLLIESKLKQHKVRMLRKNRQLLREQIALAECNIATKILCKEGSQKIKDHYTKQQQVG
ncbi:uncharacterized protein LOC110288785 [Mus caroli]|uniref:Uncharacterized protein LOC110288785 n=1 Tax=Mus caroli TaxID=10089 RepID=A0A6P5P3D7_MUSCR|nr:uncharacterized protein LOC110288785 [Mus caroli]